MGRGWLPPPQEPHLPAVDVAALLASPLLPHSKISSDAVVKGLGSRLGQIDERLALGFRVEGLGLGIGLGQLVLAHIPGTCWHARTFLDPRGSQDDATWTLSVNIHSVWQRFY